MPAGFEGGQMPIDMRVGKLRGNTSADAMPIGPFRTYNQPVNVGALQERFDAGADVTLEALKEAGLIAKLSVDVKVLGEGELTKKLSVTAHSFSKSAVEKIEAAGGTVTRLREPVERKKKRHKASAPAVEEPEIEDEVTQEPEEAEPEEAESQENE
jgi:large subunit ribosomal protein L15